ncbi:MAG: ribonuclease HII [Endomicrobium sp.]|jgi:ribonuclease HII|nr:ribonuclease HII [Endomicrobium sp.]
MDLFLFDALYIKQGVKYLAGIDEAGRGPLAGPVCAAAVILPPDAKINGLNDSKKLTAKKREFLFEEIKQKALAFSIELSDNKTIDDINILQAVFAAMRSAVLNLKIKPDLCLIDGNHKIAGLSLPQEAVIGGDAKSACIAAASILAKVTRDALMLEYAKIYPQYGFEKHKGYGTKMHIEAIRKFGACPIHRLSFNKVK